LHLLNGPDQRLKGRAFPQQRPGRAPFLLITVNLLLQRRQPPAFSMRKERAMPATLSASSCLSIV
jgi:hypothetical protein